MSILDTLQNERVWAAVAGLAGAAVMAAVDWSGPWKAARHFLVGALCATFATPTLYPAIAQLLKWAHVDPNYQFAGASFVVGAFGIYLLEFIRAAIRRARGGEQ